MSIHTTIAERILETIKQENWPEGTHLAAQRLADSYGVSRSPVTQALGWLAERGLVERRSNRGFFVCEAALNDRLNLQGSHNLRQTSEQQAYFQMAEDCFSGQLPTTVSESFLRERYALSQSQVKSVLQRVVQEGWITKNAGYGWTFLPMLNSPEALLQTYRLRIAVEPAALLEPGYRLDPQSLDRCRNAELHLLEGGIETDTADQIHERGVNFHETLVQGSGNPFFIDTIKRVNRVRRLISYRSMQDRNRYREHCRQHLHILALLEQGRQTDAADALSQHLKHTLDNYQKIQKILKPTP